MYDRFNFIVGLFLANVGMFFVFALKCKKSSYGFDSRFLSEWVNSKNWDDIFVLMFISLLFSIAAFFLVEAFFTAKDSSKVFGRKLEDMKTYCLDFKNYLTEEHDDNG